MEAVFWLTKEMERIICLSGFLARLCRLYYWKAVAEEVSLGGISAKDHVLCIGGGSLPWTALEIAGQTGARVVVLDKDPMAVRLARSVVRRLGLSHQVVVMQGDGCQVDPGDYSVLHVALQAYPREAILENLRSRALPGTRILVRVPKASAWTYAVLSPQGRWETRFEKVFFVKAWGGIPVRG